MRWQGVVRTGLRLGRRAILKGHRPGREAVSVVLLVLLATVLSLTLTSLLEGVANRPDADRIGSLVLGWTFTIAGVLTLASALQETVGQLVTAADLPLLRTAPIGASHLLAIKVAAVLPRTLFNVLGVALPAALAWATLHPGTSPFGIALALVTLWAVATGAGVSLALPLLRLVPTTVVTPALHLLSTTGFVVAWLAQALIAPRVVTAALEGRFDAALLAPPPAGSPATIAARLVTEGVRWPDLLACLAWSGASLALALVVANRLLDPLHERATLAPMRRVTVGEPRRGLVRAFLVRDAALVLRDWTITLEALAQFAVWMLLPLAALPLVPLEPTVLARLMMVSLAWDSTSRRVRCRSSMPRSPGRDSRRCRRYAGSCCARWAWRWRVRSCCWWVGAWWRSRCDSRRAPRPTCSHSRWVRRRRPSGSGSPSARGSVTSSGGTRASCSDTADA
ncbi:MAG: hypothetical protein RL721_2203 [Candidatus Eisenbacteria bacterium]